MNIDEIHAQYPGLNPAVWRPLMGLGDVRDSDPLVPVSVSVSGLDVPADSAPVSGVRSVRRRGSSNFHLPCACEHDGRVEFPEQVRAGANAAQLEKAAAMHNLGLFSKARRQASCRIYARMRSCENGHQSYQRYCCKNRYCPNVACGQKVFLILFDKYLGLDSVAQQIVPNWENRPHRKSRLGDLVIAKIDITIVNRGRMPSRHEVRRFNRDVRKLFRAAEEKFGLSYPKRVKSDGHLVFARSPQAGDYGVLWTDEFGGKSTRFGKVGNTNLHAHAVYCGPYIPQTWLSERWACIRGDGSKIVSIKPARRFGAGLYHALKYAGKFLSSDPVRLAELEAAFDRVRRVHTMGGFYNAIPKNALPEIPSPRCPECGGAMFDPTGPLLSVGFLEMRGVRDFDLLRRQVAKTRVFGGNDG